MFRDQYEKDFGFLKDVRQNLKQIEEDRKKPKVKDWRSIKLKVKPKPFR